MSSWVQIVYILTKQLGYVFPNASAILLVGFSIKAPCRIISDMEFEQLDAGFIRFNIGEVEATSISERFLSRSSI